MSLILGVNLPQFIYLVSDTRLTRRSNRGDRYEDNFSKFYSYNENLSALVAGNAHLANFILRKIGGCDLVDKGFLYFKDNIEYYLKPILAEYLAAGNQYNSTFIIFAGFDLSARKRVNASTYGSILAKTFIKGQAQTINKDILQKIVETGIKNDSQVDARKGIIGTLAKDSIIEIDQPYSSMISVEVHLPGEPQIKEIDCYKYIMKAPNELTELALPNEIAYKLENLQKDKKSGEEILQAQTVILMAWVDEIIEKNKLPTVGGDIMVNMITPQGAIIMTGALAKLDNVSKQSKIVSEIIVHEEKLCVRNRETGRIVPLQNIYEFNEKGDLEL